jgi:cellulose synthase/poly-beta-1,6-N-acetylglucosamine synthase-like glycosyltransferase
VVKQGLVKFGVQVTENQVASSQYHKVNQMIDQVHSDYLVTTQDDVIFDHQFFTELLNVIRSAPNATLIIPHIASAPSTTFFQKILERGISIAYHTGLAWNNGDNYLLANGRCMVFKTSFLQKHRVPESVVNGDAYHYFANKFGGGITVRAPRAIVYNKNPLHFKEQLNQNQRFQYSRHEMESVFKRDLTSEYAIPKFPLLRSLWSEFYAHPILTTLYVAMSLYIRTIHIDPKIVARTSWAIAKSTKA